MESRPYLAALRERAAGLPVEFEVAPSDERLRELYASCAALVFPARNEDFGMVVLEAMAAGAPVLAVDAGGPRCTVQPGVTGWLLPPVPEAFSAQMAAVLVAPEALAPMRAAAREQAAARSWDAHVARMDEVLDSVTRR